MTRELMAAGETGAILGPENREEGEGGAEGRAGTREEWRGTEVKRSTVKTLCTLAEGGGGEKERRGEGDGDGRTKG